MALGQTQEHSIKFLKQGSGAIWLYGQHEEKKYRAVESWSLFPCSFILFLKECNIDHYSSAKQKKFPKDLKARRSLVEQGTVINHFKEIGSDLTTLDTGDVNDFEIANYLREAPTIYQAMFVEFVRDRIENAWSQGPDLI